jgi:hypothetical protein
MDAILFQLKKPLETKQEDQRRFDSALFEITGNYEGTLLILSGKDSPQLGKAIQIAVARGLPYTLTFFEKATNWNYDPMTDAKPNAS